MSYPLDPNQKLSITEAGREYGVSPSSIRRMIAKGVLPAHKLNARCIRIRRGDLEAVGEWIGKR